MIYSVGIMMNLREIFSISKIKAQSFWLPCIACLKWILCYICLKYIYFVLSFYFYSSGMFISASEDKTGILGVIEEKIARATMIPRSNGEVTSLFSSPSLQKRHFVWPCKSNVFKIFLVFLLIYRLNFYYW